MNNEIKIGNWIIVVISAILLIVIAVCLYFVTEKLGLDNDSSINRADAIITNELNTNNNIENNIDNDFNNLV